MDSLRSGKSIPVPTSLEKRLFILVALLIAIAIVLTINIIHLKQSNNENSSNFKGPLDDICSTPTCISEAGNLINSMDRTVDPCTDFYSFVCGNWIKDENLVSCLDSQFTKMAAIIILRIKEVLKLLEKEKNPPSNRQKTADFYKACMDNSIEKLGTQELLSDLKTIGGWPLIDKDWRASSFDWADLMVQLFKNGYISNMLFLIQVDVDVKNTSTSLLTVGQPSLGLVKLHHYILPDEKFLKMYKDVILQLAELLRSDVDAEKVKHDIEEAFEVEYEIANMMELISMKYPFMFYNIMTLEELEELAPKIPWKKIIFNLLPAGTFISKYERIMVTSTTYIRNQNNLLEKMDNKNGKRILANYMLYRVVFDAANYLNDSYYNLVYPLLNAAHDELPTDWQVCMKTILELFPLPLAASYVKRYTNSKTKEVLGTIVKNIRNSIEDEIKRTDWFDYTTKRNALWKVKNIIAAVGYEDEIMNDTNLDHYYRNVNITNNHFGNVKQMRAFKFRQSMKGLHEKRARIRWYEEGNLLIANAYYKAAANTITIPVGVLQDTVFAADRPNYINYGSLGMIVGHELTHAFDSIGSLYDAEGNYINWWTERSWEKFKDKKQCFEEQYNSYYVPAADDYLNGIQTLAENIADNGGLMAAYKAYTTLLTGIGFEKSLPGLDYNEKQMFWIAFASVWCKKHTNESIQYTMNFDSHSLEKFRVIGPLSNIKEFSEDFNCKLNSTMNPARKCSLWK